jgi:hypothetical protein
MIDPKDDDLLPTILAAGGTAAEFCSRPEIWPLFEKWLHEDMEGEPDGSVSREFMSVTAAVTLLLVQGIEREMIAARFADLLGSS